MGQSTDELTRGIEQTRESLTRDVDELTDKISPARIAHRQKEAAGSKLRGIRDSVMGSAHAGTDRITSATENVGGTATDALHTVEQKAQGNPLGAGLVAFGAGLVLSSLIAPSKAETEVAQRALDVAKDQGQPLLDEAKSVGEDIAGGLKETAQHAVEEVKSTAQESATHVQAEATSSADTVQEAAPGT